MSEVVRAVVTPEGIPLRFVVADLGDRVSAFLLDLGFMFAAILVLALLASLSLGGLEDLAGAAVLVLFFVVRNFYFVLFELAWNGATPGKRLRGTRVIDARGGVLTAEAILARNLTRELEVFLPLSLLVAGDELWAGASPTTRLLGFAWVFACAVLPFANRERLRVGDLVAGTRVVRAPKPSLLPDVSDVQAGDGRYVFTTEQLEHYGVFELQVLEDLLRRESAVASATLEAVCEKIQARIGWPDEAHGVDRLQFLRDFYAAQRARLERGLLFGDRRADKHAARRKKKT